MTTNPDGTATCDRCYGQLPGFGVIYGLVCNHLAGGDLEELIFCYVAGCRDVALNGLVNFLTSPDEFPDWCTDDGTLLAARTVETAMLLTDVDPAGGDGARYLQLCYEHGSRDRLLANVGRTP